ncbi:MAG: glycosyltransferase family 39 protein [Bacteroidia bacterium]|nr:glycosyltransferase family 39 protein [Bacteroidia bacterium]
MAFAIKNNRLLIFLIVLISAAVFIPFIGNSPLFDWDEVNFAECAREMLVSDNYSQVQLNYRPFWEKPPFFIWLQALSMNLFGVTEFAARFPNALCGVASLVTLFVVGSKFHSKQFGLTWCLLYAASLLPHFYFKSGIIDPWFNLFIFLSLYHSFQFLNNPLGKKEISNALFAGLFLGLAVLTKGPAALIISALSILTFLLWTRQIPILKSKVFLLFVATTIFVSGSWFLVEWLRGNQKIIQGFIDYQIRLFETGDAGHDGPFAYHFIVLLLGCFPASIIFISAYMKYGDLTPYQKNMRKIMLCLFWVVLILFSVVKTKIIHYSSLCYFPLTFVATIGLVQYFDVLKFKTLPKILFWLINGLLSLAFVLVGFTDYIKVPLIANGWIKDPFAVENLQASGNWSGFEFLIGLLLLAAGILVYRGIAKNKFKQVLAGLSLNVLFICFAIAIVVPRIELYSQHAAIEFYQQRAKEHCYVETHGFKSYAYLFYSNRKPTDYTNPDQMAYIEDMLNTMEKEGHSRLTSYSTANLFWMENGRVDRPTYIVVKSSQEKDIIEKPVFTKLYQKNGFCFYKREAVEPAK